MIYLLVTDFDVVINLFGSFVYTKYIKTGSNFKTKITPGFLDKLRIQTKYCTILYYVILGRYRENERLCRIKAVISKEKNYYIA